MPTAIPPVAIVKDGAYAAPDGEIDLSRAPDLLAMLDDCTSNCRQPIESRWILQPEDSDTRRDRCGVIELPCEALPIDDVRGECISDEFADESGKDEDARLVETSESRRRRRGTAQPLTETEQMELRELHTTGMQAELEQMLRDGEVE